MIQDRERVQDTSVLSVRYLSIVPDGDEFLVGNPDRAEYVMIPAVGVRVIELLRAGNSVAETAAAIGPEVDVADFVDTLLELNFVTRESRQTYTAMTALGRSRWTLLHPLISRPAWIVYVACALLSAGLLAYWPELRPLPRDIYFLPSPLLSVVCLTLFTYVLATVHEACHWVAARAEGVDARITISRRLYFLAFETDLTRLWSLPRQRRYGPLLAGMAFDTVVVCALLVVRASGLQGSLSVAPEVDAAIRAIVVVQLAALLAQCYVFMRTDLYAVLVAATGCVNLWRVTQLSLLQKLHRVNEAQRAELAVAHERDVQVARWFVFVYAGGVALAAAVFLFFFLPATLTLVAWLWQVITAAQIGTAEFWASLVFAAIIISPRLLTAMVFAQDVARRMASRRR